MQIPPFFDNGVHFWRSYPQKRQIFGITTYDALFKFVLNEDPLRPSFSEGSPAVVLHFMQDLHQKS